MKISVVKERVAKIDKEIYKAKICIAEVEEAFRQQKEHADTLSSDALCSMIKIKEL